MGGEPGALREAGSDQPPIYLTTDGEDVTGLVTEQERRCSSIRSCLPLPNDRIFNWPIIWDPETGEQWQIRLPEDAPSFRLLAVQIGPFLQVIDVENCLPLRASPSPDAEEFACMAERVLLTNLGEASEADGTTWHRVRTPSCTEGWADAAYLE